MISRFFPTRCERSMSWIGANRLGHLDQIVVRVFYGLGRYTTNTETVAPAEPFTSYCKVRMFLPLIIIFVVLTSAYSAQNYHPDHLSRTWTRLQLSLLFKVKKFWPPAKSEKGERYTRPSYISPFCYLLFHLTLSQTKVLFKHRYT